MPHTQGLYQFEIHKSMGKKHRYYWKLIHPNGKTLCTSKMVHNRADVVSTIEEIKKHNLAGAPTINCDEDEDFK